MSNENENLSLAAEERDTVCEMTTIAMGAAGSTLGMLLGQDIDIPTPSISEFPTLADMDVPFGDSSKMLVIVRYSKGIDATSVFIVRDSDSRRLATTMMGGGESTEDAPLSELETSALGELMNQMMNAAATGLASLIHEPVEVNNPQIIPYTSDALAQALPAILSEPFIGINIQMKNSGGEPFELIELRVASEIKAHVNKLMSVQPGGGELDNDDPMSATMSLDELMDNIPEPAMAGARGGAREPVTVRPVEFASFDNQPHIFGEENKNLALVMDVRLNLTVELGKTDMSIKEVLELTRGSVIELERIAGEPVDLMANGKLIAKGEVVVIEDNFGLRITSIISPADRLRGLQ
jgi:flagellar motor switch protein FliN/FliY